jgi:23S rRNA (cytidine1920-2'-O)/16S rRNA (cytidine1409-2'-O)-methyltransferase
VLYKEDEPWANLAVIDVSFIALDKVLKPCFDSLDAKTGEAVCLVKPQFEVGREKVGKGGVVRNPEDHISVLENVIDLANRLHLSVKGIHHSPIKGPAGNIEFLIHLSRKIENENTGDQIERIDGIKRIDIESIQIDVQTIVVNAHKLLNVD